MASSNRPAEPTQSATQFLAKEFASTRFEDIPVASLAAVRRLIIDHVGITYMGAAFTGQAILAYAKELGGREEAVLLGDGAKLPAELAAGVNAQLCRNTDFEETGPGTHVGPLIVHTALAVGQRVGASGRDVLAAATLGYMLAARFHFARLNDWPRTSIVHHKTFAAAIAGRLMGFDAAAMARAISLAWEIPPRIHIGGGAAFSEKRIDPLALSSGLGAPLFGARNGIQAAAMIGHGFESVPDEIDQYLDEYDAEVLMGMPAPFARVEGEMELKPWICSRHSQCGMQGVDNLVKAHSIDAQSVSGIRLGLSNMYQKPWLNDPSPQNYWEAIYSTQWATAMILQQIPAGPQWVTPDRLRDPLSRRLAAMIEITEDPEASRAYWELDWLAIRGTAEIDIGGETHRTTCTMRETYGSPGMDMPEDMVTEKFRETAAGTLSTEQADRLLAALRDLESIADIRDLAGLF